MTPPVLNSCVCSAFRVEFCFGPKMTKSLKEKVGLSAPDVKLLRDIQRVGWHVTGVFAQKDEKGPEWAFQLDYSTLFSIPK
jgi:hypothetical protein